MDSQAEIKETSPVQETKQVPKAFLFAKIVIALAIAFGAVLLVIYLANVVMHFELLTISDEEAAERFGELWTSLDNPRLYVLGQFDYNPPGCVFALIGLILCIGGAFAIKAINGYISKNLLGGKGKAGDQSLAWAALLVVAAGYLLLIYDLVASIVVWNSGSVSSASSLDSAVSLFGLSSQYIQAIALLCAIVATIMLLIYFFSHANSGNYLHIKWPMLFSTVIFIAVYLIFDIIVGSLDNIGVLVGCIIALIILFAFSIGRGAQQLVIDVTGKDIKISKDGKITDAQTGEVLTTKKDIAEGRAKLVDRDIK